MLKTGSNEKTFPPSLFLNPIPYRLGKNKSLSQLLKIKT